MLSTIAEIVRDLLIFVFAIAALLVALIAIVSYMPETNPLKRILIALSYRLLATLAAGAVAIPLEPIPGVDVLYDFGVPIVLVWYWFTFFKNARRIASGPLLHGDDGHNSGQHFHRRKSFNRVGDSSV